MKLKSLDDLLLDQLQDLYGAEGQLIKALPKMAKAASAQPLQEAFREHLDETKRQRERLEQVFRSLDQKPKAKKCKGMQGLIEEGQELMEEDAEPAVLDAGLIAAAQRVEHYEMAAYGTVRTLAQTLGHQEAADLLQQTLDEEGETDHLLTDLAESQVNPRAEKPRGNGGNGGRRSSAQRRSGSPRRKSR
jgi:ferritin-like metal-binding protein YciE